jgi:hypothetical protein
MRTLRHWPEANREPKKSVNWLAQSALESHRVSTVDQSCRFIADSSLETVSTSEMFGLTGCVVLGRAVLVVVAVAVTVRSMTLGVGEGSCGGLGVALCVIAGSRVELDELGMVSWLVAARPITIPTTKRTRAAAPITRSLFRLLFTGGCGVTVGG